MGIPDDPDDKKKEIYVAIWAKAVDTQMHFNEMSVKSRQFGLAFVAAALGLAIALWSRDEEFTIPIKICGGFELHATVLIVLAAAFALYAVRILDLNVYHKMLRGAVTFGEDFEENYMKTIFQLEKGMTQAISHYSRHSDANVEKDKPKYHYIGSDKKSASEKIKLFYDFSTYTLIVVAVMIFLMTANFGHIAPPSGDHKTQAAGSPQTKAPQKQAK